MLRRETPNRFSKTPFGPVSHHRPADPTGGRETDANLIRAVVATTSPHQDGALRGDTPFGGGQKVRATLDSENRDRDLGGQTLAAAQAAAGDDLAAVLGSHAGAKAVTTFANQARRLIGPLHETVS